MSMPVTMRLTHGRLDDLNQKPLLIPKQLFQRIVALAQDNHSGYDGGYLPPDQGRHVASALRRGLGRVGSEEREPYWTFEDAGPNRQLRAFIALLSEGYGLHTSERIGD